MTTHPEPPLRVLCERDTGMATYSQWFFVYPNGMLMDWKGRDLPPSELTPIPHPKNDPEAVELINDSKKEN